MPWSDILFMYNTLLLYCEYGIFKKYSSKIVFNIVDLPEL